MINRFQSAKASRATLAFGLLVGGSVTVLAGALFARQASDMSPLLSRILSIILAISGRPVLLPPREGGTLQLLWIGWMNFLLCRAFSSIAAAWSAVAGITIIRVVEIFAWEAGAPILAMALGRRGVPHSAARWLVLLYAIQPMVLAKLSVDLLMPPAPFILLAWLGRLSGSRWWPLALVPAIGCHPLGCVAAALWTFNGRKTGTPVSDRPAVLALVLFCGALVVSCAGVILPRFLWQPDRTLVGMFSRMELHAMGEVWARGWGAVVYRVVRNFAGVFLLILTTGLFVLRKPALLIIVSFDFMYYLLTPAGLNHGLLLSTVAYLIILSAEAICSSEGTPAGANRLVERGAVACSLILSITLGRGLIHQALGTRSPLPHYSGLAAADRFLQGRNCLVEPSLAPYFYGRCRDVSPWANDGLNASVGGAPSLVVLSPSRLSAPRKAWPQDAFLTNEKSHRFLSLIADSLRREKLRVRYRSDTLIVLDTEEGEVAPSEVLRLVDKVILDKDG